jgi:two-component system LytT family response regulator/two-component system response regulator LytT
MRALLADDEQPARDELAYLIGRIGGVELVGQAGDGVEALEAIARLQPDLVFLDVQMPGLTGFEVARRLLEEDGRTAQIVFVTAFDQYAIEAFEVNAVDYLLKPVDPTRLEAAIDRARRRAPVEGTHGHQITPTGRPTLSRDQLDHLAQFAADRRSRRDQLALKVGERFLLVHADEIVHASTSDESITVVTDKHAGTSSYRTLDELQAHLDPSVFWRVHRAHLVNINKIKEIVPWFSRNYILTMKDEKATEIPVSRTQTKRLRDYLKL